MGCKVEGNKIILTRGDSAALEVSMTKDGEPYTPEPGDVVRFALKHAAMNAKRTQFKDDEPLVLRDIPIETLMLELRPADTKDLDFGEYRYDVEITFSDGFVDTFIEDAPFELTPEVH